MPSSSCRRNRKRNRKRSKQNRKNRVSESTPSRRQQSSERMGPQPSRRSLGRFYNNATADPEFSSNESDTETLHGESVTVTASQDPGQAESNKGLVII